MMYGFTWDTATPLTFAWSILPILLIGLTVTLKATSLGFLIALVLVAIADIDQPYQGAVRVAPQGFQFAARTLHNLPSP